MAIVVCLAASPALAQEPDAEEKDPAADKAELPVRELPADSKLTTTAQVAIRGASVPYRVTTGTQPVYGEDDATIAALHYTYYERTDVSDIARRPLFISFNGGPGSGSLWMHLGYTSPKQLLIDDEGFPVQPYGIRDNPHSILDVADIVYVNPANTGFSRVLDDEIDREVFFGVEADITYLADWIDVFVSRNGRWRSPKYLIGESYGTTRVSGLAGQLQNRHWMYLNGVILVSPTGLGMRPEGPAPRSSVLKLPYYAAAAHYHGRLDQDLQNLELEELLTEVENFTLDDYLPALSRGGFLAEEARQEIARQVARYAGLSEEFVLDHNLAVSASAFWKELPAARRGLHHRPTRLALSGDRQEGRRGPLRLPARAHLLEPRLCTRHQSLLARRARNRDRPPVLPFRAGAAVGRSKRARCGRGAQAGDGPESVPRGDGAVGLLRRRDRLFHRQVRALEPGSKRPAQRPDALRGLRKRPHDVPAQ
jgi:carboxypeptidase C (cathepsin A)